MTMTAGGDDHRAIKRVKANGHADQSITRAHRTGSSKVFAPYRTVGLVSPTATPFVTAALGKTSFHIITSVGNALHTYDLKRGLNLVFITRPQTPHRITATLAWKNHVFAAWGDLGGLGGLSGVWIFRRGKKLDELEMPAGHVEAIQSLRVLGSWIIGVCQSSVLVWQTASLEHYTTLRTMPGSTFTGATATIPTLLNKVLLGKDDGSVEIWNVSTGKLVHTMLPDSSALGPVRSLEPAPAVGLVAIGHSDGTVVIRDVFTDEQLISIFAGTDSQNPTPITSIAFRTDGLGAGDDGRKSGVLATASTASGHITLWDLNGGGRKSGVLRGAHAAQSKAVAGGVSKIEFLSGQAILVSSGLDNHLNTWIFDETPFSAIPRPLHSRGGHGGPVTRLHFLPSASDGSDMSGKWLLASSADRSLWGWSLRKDGQSTELSQGAIKKKAKKSGIMSSDGRDFLEGLKAPPITAMACSLNRDGGMGALPGKLPIWQSPAHVKSTAGAASAAETSSMTGWESVVTAHAGDSKARTWFWGRKRAGRWAFEASDKREITSVAVSPCGTFAVLGSAGGAIDAFNLQSGIHRGRFPPRLKPAQAKALGLARSADASSVAVDAHASSARHTEPVTGLAVDNLNRTLISSSTSGHLKFWSFATGALVHDLHLGTGVLSLTLHRPSELVALACADGTVRVLDVTTRKTVRELRATRDATNPLFGVAAGDLCFSRDGRWIVAAVAGVVLTFDLPSGHLVDVFRPGGSSVRVDHSQREHDEEEVEEKQEEEREHVAAVALSPTGEYLATASASGVGIDIWTNRASYSHVPTRHVSEIELREILDVSADGGAQGTDIQPLDIAVLGNEANEAADDEDLDTTPAVTDEELARLGSDLLSLSLVPRSRWQNLLYLDSIRARNRPIALPKKPEKAPFFLPSTNGQQPLTLNGDASQMAIDARQDSDRLAVERSRIARMDRSAGASVVTQLLGAAAAEGNSSTSLKAVTSHFKTLGPSAADLEIRSLSRASNAGGIDEHVVFVSALLALLKSRSDFELGQAWMAVYLRVHGDVVVQDPDIQALLSEWRELMDAERERLGSLVDYCAGMVGYLRAGRV